MITLSSIRCNPISFEECTFRISRSFEEGSCIQLISPKVAAVNLQASCFIEGPGVVIASGGSSGENQYCFHPFENFDKSALATANWLKQQGFDPKSFLIINPLPLHHVSGFMPWWRGRKWGAKHAYVLPYMMKNPRLLSEFCQSLSIENDRPKLLSLVPTQLHRLISDSEGLNLLKGCDVILVGGAALSQSLAEKARLHGLKLAPCYGATETASMVTALTPDEFLSGVKGCGHPLQDVDLSLTDHGVLKVRTSRLAVGRLTSSGLQSIKDSFGWWTSGDAAQITLQSTKVHLNILGRIDGAINSGGEIVFPEKLEAKLRYESLAVNLSIQNILFLPIYDEEWGQRLVVLISWCNDQSDDVIKSSLTKLRKIVCNWQPAHRPIAWYYCPELNMNEVGKWNRKRWIDWLGDNRKNLKLL